MEPGPSRPWTLAFVPFAKGKGKGWTNNCKRFLRSGGVQILLWSVFFGWTLFTACFAAYIGRAPHLYSLGGCTPAGDFLPPYYEDYNKFDIKNIFQITLGFGRMSFPTAKLIDVFWDVMVGRGGQGVLIAIAYRVFTNALTRLMEDSAVSYRTFTSLTFETATVATIFGLARDFSTNATSRAKLSIFWIILSSIWIAAFPTYTSAMTGYASNVGEYITDRNKALIPYNDVQLLDYIIHDGWRIGLGGKHLVLGSKRVPSSLLQSQMQCFDDSCACLKQMDIFDQLNNLPLDARIPLDYGPPQCLATWEVVSYVVKYGYAPSMINSTFNLSGQLIDLTPPTLNVSAFWLPYPYPRQYGNRSSNPLDSGSVFSFAGFDDYQAAQWGYNNATYNRDYLKTNGLCLPDQTYQWGFSYLLLFIFCIIQFVWSFGMYIMWTDAYLSSRYHRAGRDMGLYRAVLDFSRTIEKNLGGEPNAMGDDLIGDKELRQRLIARSKTFKAGGVLRVGPLPPLDRPNTASLPISRAEHLKTQWKSMVNSGEILNVAGFRNPITILWLGVALLLVTFVGLGYLCFTFI